MAKNAPVTYGNVQLDFSEGATGARRYVTFVAAAWILWLLFVLIATVNALTQRAGERGGAILFGAISAIWASMYIAMRQRTKLVVGADGIASESPFGGRTFVSFVDIERIDAQDKMVFGSEDPNRSPLIYGAATEQIGYFAGEAWVLVLRDGRRAAVIGANADLIELIRARMSEPSEKAATLPRLVRGERSADAWLSDLALLSAPATAYRAVDVAADELWPVVESTTAEPTARAAAAAILRTRVDDAGRARIRVAAANTAHPLVREAFDAASSDEEARVEAALRSFDAER